MYCGGGSGGSGQLLHMVDVLEAFVSQQAQEQAHSSLRGYRDPQLSGPPVCPGCTLHGRFVEIPVTVFWGLCSLILPTQHQDSLSSQLDIGFRRGVTFLTKTDASLDSYLFTHLFFRDRISLCHPRHLVV